VLDKTNLEQLAQKFERRLNVERFSFHGDSHHKMAENIRSLVLNQRLTIYPNAGYVEKSDGSYDTLVTEIANLIVVERAGLYRLDHRPGFHDDAYCFIKGTQIETENGPLPIELVKAGMKVLTRQGYKIVSNAGFTRVAPIFKLTTDDKILYGTGNHPIYCNGEWVAMENIKANDTIYTWKMHQMKSNGTVSHTDAIQNQSIYHTDDTIKRTHNGKARLDTCTGTYGKLPMEQFHLNTISTIKTETHSTMNYQILNAFHQENTLTNTIINGSATKLLNQNESKQCGMDLTNGARSEQKHYHQTETKWSAFAFSAETYSRRTSIDLPKLVPIVVRHVMDMGIHQPVYNLTVEDSPEYFANGLLVHNCATAMACLEAVKYRTMPKFHFNAAPEPISPMPRKQTPIDVAAIEREKLKNAKWD
jgi:hypothetical protein